jgi:hypothetical protein
MFVWMFIPYFLSITRCIDERYIFYLQKLIHKKLQGGEEGVYLVQRWCSWRRRSDVRLVVVFVEELELLLLPPVLEKKETEWWRLSVCWSCCCCRYVERRRPLPEIRLKPTELPKK